MVNSSATVISDRPVTPIVQALETDFETSLVEVIGVEKMTSWHGPLQEAYGLVITNTTSLNDALQNNEKSLKSLLGYDAIRASSDVAPQDQKKYEKDEAVASILERPAIKSLTAVLSYMLSTHIHFDESVAGKLGEDVVETLDTATVEAVIARACTAFVEHRVRFHESIHDARQAMAQALQDRDGKRFSIAMLALVIPSHDLTGRVLGDEFYVYDPDKKPNAVEIERSKIIAARAGTDEVEREDRIEENQVRERP